MILNGINFGQNGPSRAKQDYSFIKRSKTGPNEVKQAQMEFNSGKQGKTRIKWG